MGGVKLLTPEWIAERCEISTRTVMRAIRAGELKASQLAERGCWRIKPEDLDAWIEARANRARTARPPSPRTAPLLGAPTSRVRKTVRRREGANRLYVPSPNRSRA